MNFVPMIDDMYEKVEYYEDLEKIFDSKQFLPIYIKGPSGVAKTLTVEQLCANKNLPMIRVNITNETDEDSLMGGFRLKNGETYFDKGPVVKAMEIGAVLVLDEYDLGSPLRIMCLQSVLEGKGYFIKKTGEMVYPKPGFMIVATANTKSTGDDTGLYVGTQILNEAALDRFPVMFEAHYPNINVEKKILMNYLVNSDIKDKDEICDLLIKFANEIRSSIEKTGDSIGSISTRRLVQIINVFKIFKDLEKSILLCISRFDDDHKQAYMRIFEAIQPSKNENKEYEETVETSKEDFLKELRSLKPF